MGKYTQLILASILFFAFVTRIWQLHFPEQYIFDEVYHGVTSKLVARNDPRAYEWWHPGPEPDTAIDWLHPPLAKYTQAIGMLIFGENTFGWRVSSAVFGVGVIYFTYFLAKKLFNDQVGLMAAFIASLDGLLLTQSRIAMNDIHVTFFILLTLIVYLKYQEKSTHSFITPLLKKQRGKEAKAQRSKSAARWLFLTGISAGLAMGSKWSGLFVLATVGVFEIATMAIWLHGYIKKHPFNHTAILTIKALFTYFLFLLVVPLTVYVLSYSHMFLQGKSLFCNQNEHIPGKCYYEVIKWGDKVLYQGYISHFNQLHRQIWHYQTHLEATHTYQSRPYQWFFNLRPVWYYVKYADNTLANIYAFGNPAVFWLGSIAVIWTMLNTSTMFTHGVSSFMKKRKALLFVTFSYLMVWLPWQLSPRIMFFYHYTPAVPLLSIILAYWLYQISDLRIMKYEVGKPLVTFCFLLLTFCFVVWYPNWTGTPVPQDFAETVYFAVKSWR